MSSSNFTVYVVDDDASVLRALERLLTASGFAVRCFSSSEEFLAGRDPSAPSCVILDVSLPGGDGLAAQQALASGGNSCPVIFVTGTTDIPTSVRALKAGAVDFLTKPVQLEALLSAIARAEVLDSAARQQHEERQTMSGRLEQLTPRERQVLAHVVAGRLNKQIAAELGTVERTIKVHRGRMMSKMGARHIADLVRFAMRAGVMDGSHGGIAQRG